MKQVVALTRVGLVLGLIIAIYIVESNKNRTASTTYILDLRKQVDSLTAEVELRDQLLNRCKDTVYGEEVVETNNQ